MTTGGKVATGLVGALALTGLIVLGVETSKDGSASRSARDREENARYRSQRATQRAARRDRRLTQARDRAGAFNGVGNRGRDAIVGAIIGGGAGLVAGVTIGLWDVIADGGGHFWRDTFGGLIAGSGGGAVLGALL